MEDIHPILREVTKQPQKGLLAMIVHVEGSAYRKEGTSMLVQEDGSQIGLLSGGCLENDIHARFDDIWENGSRLITYDMRGYDELSWGVGSGCNGIIHVMLEPVNDMVRSHLTQLKEKLDQGCIVLMTKKLQENGGDVETLFQTAEDAFGNWLAPVPEAGTAARSGLRFLEETMEHVYVHALHPKPRLFVFGANPDARPLVQLAAQSGFLVTVCDWRPALCRKEFFPEAADIFVGFPEEMKARLAIGADDYAVLLTHHFQRDKELLPYLMNQNPKYLGVLGSRSRTARLLEKPDVPETITTPVGLSIQAEGPDEIAVSIVAELIMVSKEQRKQDEMLT